MKHICFLLLFLGISNWLIGQTIRFSPQEILDKRDSIRNDLKAKNYPKSTERTVELHKISKTDSLAVFTIEELPWVYFMMGDIKPFISEANLYTMYLRLDSDSLDLSPLMVTYFESHKSEIPFHFKNSVSTDDSLELIQSWIRLELLLDQCNRSGSRKAGDMFEDSLIDFYHKHPGTTYWRKFRFKFRARNRFDFGATIPGYIPLGHDYQKFTPSIGLGYVFRYSFKNWSFQLEGHYTRQIRSKDTLWLDTKAYDINTEFGIREWRIFLGYNILVHPQLYLTPLVGFGWRKNILWEKTDQNDETAKHTVSSNPIFLYGLSLFFLPELFEEPCNGFKYDDRNFAFFLSTQFCKVVGNEDNFRFNKTLMISAGVLIGIRFQSNYPGRDYKRCKRL